MARRRKSGTRTKSGRLSRAYKGPARDPGTAELQVKKLAAVNGRRDPALSATPASILFAHAVIDRDQLAAAERYRRCYPLSFGLPWRGACILGDHRTGTALPDDVIARAPNGQPLGHDFPIDSAPLRRGDNSVVVGGAGSPFAFVVTLA